MGKANEIYFGTVAMERNRWKRQQSPQLVVSEWLDRYAEAGFDGLELWEFHATEANAPEVQAIEAHKLPVRIFNSYTTFTNEERPAIEAMPDWVVRLGCEGVKWNVPRDPAMLPQVKRNIGTWLEAMPAELRLLCECHAGTPLERPRFAQEFFGDLADNRTEIIFHGPPTEESEPTLQEWFDRFGEKVTHMHVQTRGGRFDRTPSESARRFDDLRRLGFQGTVCLEFVEGSASKEESEDLVWENALADLTFLKQHLPASEEISH